MTRALVITGPFRDWELELIAICVREIEKGRPEETFTIAVDDVDSQGFEAALDLLATIFPRRERTN